MIVGELKFVTIAGQPDAAGIGFRRCALTASLLLLAAWDPVSLTVFGVGTAPGVQHTLNGLSFKMFTTPLPQVRPAAITGLSNMGLEVPRAKKPRMGG